MTLDASELRLIVDAVPALISRVDRELRFTFINRAHAEFLERAPEEIVGRRVEEVLDAEGYALALPYMRRALAGERVTFERSRRQRDGSIRWLSLLYLPERDALGAVTGLYGLHTDITESKRAGDALRDSENRFRRLAEISSDWFWEQDAQLRFTLVSEGFSHAAGRKPASLLGKTRWELPNQAYDAQARAALEAALAGRRPFSDFEIRFSDDAGRERWCSISGTPLFDAAGAFAGYRGVGKEISERKRYAEALRDKEAQLRLIVDSVPALISHTGPDDRFLFVNRALAELYGRPEHEIIGRKRSDMLSAEDNRVNAPYIERALAGERVSYERTHTAQDGTERTLALNLVPQVDAGARVVGLYGLHTDITELKRAERILRLEHQVARALSGAEDENAGLEAVMRAVCETEGWLVGRYFRFDEASGLLRFDHGWCAPGHGLEWFLDHSRGVEYAPGIGLLGKVLGRGEPMWSADVRHDPRIQQVALAHESPVRGLLAFAVKAEGVAIGAFAFSTTQMREPDERLLSAAEVIGGQIGLFVRRKRAEAALRQLNVTLEQRVAERTRELEAANHELEAFSFSVSHDLRAPLRAIESFSQLLEREAAALLPEKARQMLSRIRANATSMAALIDGLLGFARASRAPLARVTVLPGELVSEVLEMLAPQTAGRDLRIEVAELPACDADPVLLRQVWLNLIDNALKYSSRRAAARVEIGAQPGAGAAVYFVRDNGAGFDMTYAGKLFGVFERLHAEDEFPGTGIGLATVRSIVSRHGGRVWAEGAPERGATFYFTLQ